MRHRLTEEKTYNFYSYFMFTDSQRKKVKLKDVVRLGGLYAILTRERGFRL